MGKCTDVIVGRRTIRRFKQDSIAREDLVDMVNAGRLAATAGNMQPWEFIIVDDRGLVEELCGSLGWLGGAPDELSRPTALIVLLLSNPRDKWSAWADGGAAVQNMQLVAWEKGIGSCWIGSVAADVFTRLLEIPDTLKLFSVLAVGRPDESPVMEESDGEVSAKRDREGVLHVKKRKIETILHVNGYGKK
jgi:nitroreductase